MTIRSAPPHQKDEVLLTLSSSPPIVIMNLHDDDLINEQHFMQIVAWNSIIDETERSTTQKIYEDNLQLAMIKSSQEQQTYQQLCALDDAPLSSTLTSSLSSGNNSRSNSSGSSNAATRMSSFVAELELAIQVSSQDEALRHEEAERRRFDDEEMIANLSALISDEEEDERQKRDREYEAELQLAIQQSESEQQHQQQFLLYDGGTYCNLHRRTI